MRLGFGARVFSAEKKEKWEEARVGEEKERNEEGTGREGRGRRCLKEKGYASFRCIINAASVEATRVVSGLTRVAWRGSCQG